MTFWDKYHNIIKKNNSYVCVGLDSEFSKLPKHLKNSKDPIFEFNKEIIDATKDFVACYKPNFAFYLSQGLASLESLKKTIEYIPDHIPIILDVKVGDIGNTMTNYAEAFFNDWKVDAITCNPLMGKDVVQSLIPFEDKFVFMLALTSNPSARDYFKPHDLYRRISQDIAALPFTQFGAVVGATHSEQLRELRDLMPNSLFLVPGIGAQGGSLQEVIESTLYSKLDARFLINSSRGIIFADSSKAFAEVAGANTEHLRNQINTIIDNI
ncbi:MAG: orotidine-5'-phosphate decarboxylase [Candidatus Cloacimonadales bacterium]